MTTHVNTRTLVSAVCRFAKAPHCRNFQGKKSCLKVSEPQPHESSWFIMIFAYFRHSNIHFLSFLPSPVLDPYSCPPVSTCNKGEDQPSSRDKELVAAVFIKCLAECLDRVESTTINDHQRPLCPCPNHGVNQQAVNCHLGMVHTVNSLYNVYTHFWWNKLWNMGVAVDH